MDNSITDEYCSAVLAENYSVVAAAETALLKFDTRKPACILDRAEIAIDQAFSDTLNSIQVKDSKILTADDSGEVKEFSEAEFSPLKSLNAHSNLAIRAEYNPDTSNEIVSIGMDFTLNIWNSKKSESKPYLSIDVQKELNASRIGEAGQLCNPPFPLDFSFRPGYTNYYYLSLGDGSLLEVKKAKKSKTKHSLDLTSQNQVTYDKLVRAKFATSSHILTLAKDSLKVHQLASEEPFLDMQEIEDLQYEGSPNDMVIAGNQVFVAEESPIVKVFEFQ